MKLIQRVWNDIKRGENVDLYLTFVVAVAVGTAGLLGIAKLEQVVSLILAVLALLAFSTLKSRYQIEEATRSLGQSSGIVFLEEYPASRKEDIEKAAEVWFVGVSLSRTVKTYYVTIEAKLWLGHTIRVLILHPVGLAVQIAETRVYGRMDVERKSREIKTVMQDWCDLKKIAPDKLLIRTIQYPLSYGATAINPNSDSGILYLEHYPFKRLGSMPKFILTARDGNWYAFFKQELLLLWENGSEWDCNA